MTLRCHSPGKRPQSRTAQMNWLPAPTPHTPDTGAALGKSLRTYKPVHPMSELLTHSTVFCKSPISNQCIEFHHISPRRTEDVPRKVKTPAYTQITLHSGKSGQRAVHPYQMRQSYPMPKMAEKKMGTADDQLLLRYDKMRAAAVPIQCTCRDQVGSEL